MLGASPTLGKIARRVLLIGVAATPALVQALTTPRFRIIYEAGPRAISVSPPSGDLISFGFRDGTVRVGRDDVLTELRTRIADRRAEGRSTTWWEQRLADLEAPLGTKDRCRVPAPVLAALLSRGDAQVTGLDGGIIDRIAEWRIAWVYDGRPMSYGEGDGRAFMVGGVRYRPDPEGPDCGVGCLVYAGDHQTHSDYVM